MSPETVLARSGLIFLLMLCSNLALALGPSGSGGGDLCENRLGVVRDDIASWILKGGPAGLQLPDGITQLSYGTEMLSEIKSTRLRCVGQGDKGYPVAIGDSPKVCRFDKLSDGDLITCDLEKFLAVPESDQYVLVHHEFAGLAGFENPFGEISTYALSNQISGFLAEETVKKLVIKPVEVASGPTLEWNFKTGYKSRRVLSQSGQSYGKAVEYINPIVINGSGDSFYLYNGMYAYNSTFDGFCMIASRENGDALMKSSSVEQMSGWTSEGISLVQRGQVITATLNQMGSPSSRAHQVKSIVCRTVSP